MFNENTSKRRLDLYEVLELVVKQKARKDKIQVLQAHQSPPLLDYIRCVFDDRVQFNLPDGKPPYTPNVEGSIPSSWNRQHKKLQYIVKGLKGDDMLQLKRETIFIGVLESVHAIEAEVLVDMINKKPYKGITKKLVQEAFPSVIKD